MTIKLLIGVVCLTLVVLLLTGCSSGASNQYSNIPPPQGGGCAVAEAPAQTNIYPEYMANLHESFLPAY